MLHQRIAVRFEQMLKDGLVDELRGLRQKYALHRDMTSMRCVGYRQAWAALDVNGRAGPDPKVLWLDANCVDQEALCWFGSPPQDSEE